MAPILVTLDGSVNGPVKLEQFSNAPLPILVTLERSRPSVKPEHLLNA